MEARGCELDPAALWFSQFIPYKPAGWEHDQWCWRHWAPCPLYDANGIAASLEVMATWRSAHVPLGTTFAEANVLMAEAGKLCCALGDDAMFRVWGRNGPERSS
jgi:hypothetical protein